MFILGYTLGAEGKGEGQDWGGGELVRGTLVLYMHVFVFLKKNISVYFVCNVSKKPN